MVHHRTPSSLENRQRVSRAGTLVWLLLVPAVVLPFVLTDYQVFQATMVLVYAVALLGLNILTGYNGQISVGHGAFYAVGAYTAAIAMDMAQIPYWATPPMAAAVCFVAGFLFGLPALRLIGLYLALATFALAVALPQLLKFRLFEDWTGGVQGIVLFKPEAPLGLPLSPDQWIYLYTLLLTVAAFWLARNLLSGRIGRALVSIRDHPVAAGSMGIPVGLYKTVTFGISAMFTGVAGALGAIAVQFVAPESFTIFLSISLLVGVVVGGLGSLSGAFYGAMFIQFVPNIADSLSEGAPWALYGVMLIVCTYLAPRGISGGLQDMCSRLARRNSI